MCLAAVHVARDRTGAGGLFPRAAYEARAKNVGGSLSWATLSAQGVAAKPEVQQIVKSIKVLGDSPAITGVMHPYQADRLTPAQRKDLLAKLGVDALLVADVKIRCGGTSGFALGGMGKDDDHESRNQTASRSDTLIDFDSSD